MVYKLTTSEVQNGAGTGILDVVCEGAQCVSRSKDHAFELCDTHRHHFRRQQGPLWMSEEWLRVGYMEL